MKFDWDRYLELANELGEVGAVEASHRSAVSRAYYSVFHLAKDVARIRHKYDLPTEDAHFRLWHHYNSVGEIEIANDLQRLSTSRKVADYEDELPAGMNPSRFSEKNLIWAEGLKRRLSDL